MQACCVTHTRPMPLSFSVSHVLYARRRFESLSGQQLAQIIAVACITGLLWWQRARTYDVANGADITGLLFFEMVFVSFRYVCVCVCVCVRYICCHACWTLCTHAYLTFCVCVCCIQALFTYTRIHLDVRGSLFALCPHRSLFQALFTFPNEFRILSKERPSGAP